MLRPNVAGRVTPNTRLARAAFGRGAPHPGVSKPEAGEHDNGCVVARAICDGNSHMNIVGRSFSVRRNHIEISVFCEHPGIDELILRKFQTAAPVSLDELIIWERRLRVFV